MSNYTNPLLTGWNEDSPPIETKWLTFCKQRGRKKKTQQTPHVGSSLWIKADHFKDPNIPNSEKKSGIKREHQSSFPFPRSLGSEPPSKRKYVVSSLTPDILEAFVSPKYPNVGPNSGDSIPTTNRFPLVDFQSTDITGEFNSTRTIQEQQQQQQQEQQEQQHYEQQHYEQQQQYEQKLRVMNSIKNDPIKVNRPPNPVMKLPQRRLNSFNASNAPLTEGVDNLSQQGKSVLKIPLPPQSSDDSFFGGSNFRESKHSWKSNKKKSNKNKDNQTNLQNNSNTSRNSSNLLNENDSRQESSQTLCTGEESPLFGNVMYNSLIHTLDSLQKVNPEIHYDRVPFVCGSSESFIETVFGTPIKHPRTPLVDKGIDTSYWDNLCYSSDLAVPSRVIADKYEPPIITVEDEIKLMSRPYIPGIPECISGIECLMRNLSSKVGNDDSYTGMSYVTPQQLTLLESGTITGRSVSQGLCYFCMCIEVSSRVHRANLTSSSPTRGNRIPSLVLKDNLQSGTIFQNKDPSKKNSIGIETNPNRNSKGIETNSNRNSKGIETNPNRNSKGIETNPNRNSKGIETNPKRSSKGETLNKVKEEFYDIVLPFSVLLAKPGGFSPRAVHIMSGSSDSVYEYPFRHVDYSQFSATTRKVVLYSEGNKKRTEKVVQTFQPRKEFVYSPSKLYSIGIIPLVPKYCAPLAAEQIKVLSCEYLLRNYYQNLRKTILPFVEYIDGNPSVVYPFLEKHSFTGFRQRGIRIRQIPMHGCTSLVKTCVEQNMYTILFEGRPFDLIFCSNIHKTSSNLKILLEFFGYVKTLNSDSGSSFNGVANPNKKESARKVKVESFENLQEEENREIKVIKYPLWRLSEQLEIFSLEDLNQSRTIYHALHLRVNIALQAYQHISNQHKNDKRTRIMRHLISFIESHEKAYRFFILNGDPSYHLIVPDSAFEITPNDSKRVVCLDTRGYCTVNENRKLSEILFSGSTLKFNMYPEDVSAPYTERSVTGSIAYSFSVSPQEKIRKYLTEYVLNIYSEQSIQQDNNLDKTIYSSSERNGGKLPGKKLNFLLSEISDLFNITLDSLVSQIFCDFNSTRNLLRNYANNIKTLEVKKLVHLLDNCSHWFPFSEPVKRDPSVINLSDTKQFSIVLSLILRINLSLEICNRLKEEINLFVCEESEDIREIILNLRLFSHTHIDLIHHITSTQRCSDGELETPIILDTMHSIFNRGVSMYDTFYPHEHRYIHEGDLPNSCHVNSLIQFLQNELKVNKISKIDWLHACSSIFECGSFSTALLVSENSGLLRLILYVGLAGLYKHCKRYPGFSKTVELYISTQLEHNQEKFGSFCKDNQYLLMSLLSEYQNYMITNFMPDTYSVLTTLFPSWFNFSRACVSINESLRADYSTEGVLFFNNLESRILRSYDNSINICKKPCKNFILLLELTIKSMETKIQQITSHFISEILDGVISFGDKKRCSQNLILLGLTALRMSLEDEQILQSFIREKIPGEDIDITEFLRLEDYTGGQFLDLRSIELLHKCWKLYQSETEKLTQNSLEKILSEVSPIYYDKLCNIISNLRAHNAITIKPAPYHLALEQTRALWHKFRDREESMILSSIPLASHLFVYAPCCDQVKTPCAQDEGFKKTAIAKSGPDKVALDTGENRLFCYKKNLSNSKASKYSNILCKLSMYPTSCEIDMIYLLCQAFEDETLNIEMLFSFVKRCLDLCPENVPENMLLKKNGALNKQTLSEPLQMRRSLMRAVFYTTHSSYKRRLTLGCGINPVGIYPLLGNILCCESIKHGTFESYTICPRCGSCSLYTPLLYGLNGFTCYVCDEFERSKTHYEPCIVCNAYGKIPNKKQVCIFDDRDDGLNHFVTCSLCPNCFKVYTECSEPHDSDSNYNRSDMNTMITVKTLLMHKNRELVTSDSFIRELYSYAPDMQTQHPL